MRKHPLLLCSIDTTLRKNSPFTLLLLHLSPFCLHPSFFFPFLSALPLKSVPIFSVFSQQCSRKILLIASSFQLQDFLHAASQAEQFIESNLIKVSGLWLGSDVWQTDTQTGQAPLTVQLWPHKWPHLLQGKNIDSNKIICKILETTITGKAKIN